jgi:AICAR transformylase/IMP cyclohydrolase PurH
MKRRALFSVEVKTPGVVRFAGELRDLGFDILASEGTAMVLMDGWYHGD